jgi:hypothetical protein
VTPLVEHEAEHWREISDAPGYEVSTWGRVRNTKRGTLLRQYGNYLGYARTQLQVGCRPQNFRVHRLVAIAFIDNPDDLPEVHHIDHDVTNNHWLNLEWVSRSDNELYKYVEDRQ